MNSRYIIFCAALLIIKGTSNSVSLYEQSSLINNLIKIEQAPPSNNMVGQVEAQAMLLVGDEISVPVGERNLQFDYNILGQYLKSMTSPQYDSIMSKILDAYLYLDIFPTLFMELGKKNVKSGTAYFKSPTDFFDRDPEILKRQTATAYDKTREGTCGLGLLYLGSKFSIYEFFSPKINWAGKKIVDQFITSKQQYLQSYTKLSLKVALSDIDLLYYWQINKKDEFSSKIGFNCVTLIKEKLEIHADGVINQNTEIMNITKDSIYDVNRKNVNWHGQITLGLNYSFNNNINLIMEYFYNGIGHSGKKYQNILDYSSAMSRMGDRGAYNVMYSYGLFNLAKHYCMQRISYSTTDYTIESSVSNLLNIIDGSGLINPKVSLLHDRKIKFNFEGGYFYGKQKTELRIQPLKYFLKTNIELFIL